MGTFNQIPKIKNKSIAKKSGPASRSPVSRHPDSASPVREFQKDFIDEVGPYYKVRFTVT